MSKIRIKQIFSYISTTCLTGTCIFTSCSKSQQTSISCTESTNLTAQLSTNNSTVVVFPSFSYVGNLNPNDMRIESTFKQGFASFDPSIVDWNVKTHTFSIKLTIKNIFAESVSGEFLFWYQDKLIQYESKVLTINFTPYTAIGLPDNITQTTTKLPDGSDIFATFSHFHYNNIPDPSLLHVTSTFVLDDVIFEPIIQNITDTTFDVVVTIKNASPGTATGNLLFTYAGTPISSAPTNLFTININSSVSIIPPHVRSATETIVWEGVTNVYYHNFHFDGSIDMDLIRVENNFASHGCYFASHITDVDYETNTFNVCVECTINEIPRKTLTSSFDFYYNDCLILTEPVEYELNLTQAIPDYLLDISFDTSRQKYILNKINDDIDIEDFNTLSIPPIVNEIADNAFRNNDLINKYICFLDFDSCISLEKIGSRSFEGCLSITNELKLPLNSLSSIGTYAFKGCANIPGKLVLPNSLQTLESGAFQSCSKITSVKFNSLLSYSPDSIQSIIFKDCASLNTIDLSVYKEIPTWVKKIGNYVFSEVTSLGGQIYISKSDNPDWQKEWSSYLFSEQYCFLSGDWVFFYYWNVNIYNH